MFNRRIMVVILTFILLNAGSAFAASPGDTIGTTYYDMQSSNLAGNRIWSDTLGGYHFIWTNSPVSSSGDRHVYYNFIDEIGLVSWGSGTQINSQTGAGFPTICTFADGSAAMAYHNDGNNDINFARDAGRGMGIITIIDVPDLVPGEDPAFWPKVVIDSNGTLQMLATTGAATVTLPFIYTYSTNNGTNWATPVLVDTVVNMTPMPAASRVSQKVAFVYGRPRDIASADYWDSDLYYIESADGSTWDFGSMANVTNYTNADTFRVFSDLDAIYDHNDNLHIIWSAVVYDYGTGAATYDSCALFHWSAATGIDEITRTFELAYPSLYDLNIAKVNLGIDVSGNLFAEWTRFTLADTSADAWSNGDLYFSYSTNNGNTWSTPTNMTNSQSVDCTPGNCDSDHWGSMDEIVNEYLHILYIHDTDAGAVPQGEGSDAEGQVMYLKYPNPLWSDVNEGELPVENAIGLTNYPNPFNTSTVFRFPEMVSGKLAVYNIRGELVRELTFENSSTIQWDGKTSNGLMLSSGIYFAKLRSHDAVLKRRIVMIK